MFSFMALYWGIPLRSNDVVGVSYVGFGFSKKDVFSGIGNDILTINGVMILVE